MVVSTLEKIVSSGNASSTSALPSFLVCQCLQSFCNEASPAAASSSSSSSSSSSAVTAAAGKLAVELVDTLDLSSEHVKDIFKTCIACCKGDHDSSGKKRWGRGCILATMPSLSHGWNAARRACIYMRVHISRL